MSLAAAPRRVAVLASGRGSNLQALIDAQAQGALGPAHIVLVLADRPAAPALERARRHAIAAECVERAGLNRAQHEAAVHARLQAHAIEFVCLAGYLRLLSNEFVERYAGRLLNIHPSLLPAFPGLEAQRQALEYGVKLAGATVHFVDAGVDSGAILLQDVVPVLDDDTPATLSARILEIEHRLYPRALRLLAEGRCRLYGRRVLGTAAED